jgi:hypothetical protein
LEKQRSVPSPNGTVVRNFNFETVLAALEDLDQFSTRKHHPKAYEQSVDDRLSAFAGYVRGFAGMKDQNFAATRAQVIGQIKNFIIDRTACASPDCLREFFDPLRTAFDLTVASTTTTSLIVLGTGTTASACQLATTKPVHSISQAFVIARHSIRPCCCTYMAASALTSPASVLYPRKTEKSFDMPGRVGDFTLN